MNALTDLQKRMFLKAYIEKGELGLAYQAVKPRTKKESAQVLGSKLYKTLLSEIKFDELFEQLGFDDVNLAMGFIDGARATRTISATVIIKSDDPKVKTKQANARDVDFIDVPDFATRHKYLESIARMRGKLIDRMALGGGEDGKEPMNVIFTDVATWRKAKESQQEAEAKQPNE